jgi:hypothetical protein
MMKQAREQARPIRIVGRDDGESFGNRVLPNAPKQFPDQRGIT